MPEWLNCAFSQFCVLLWQVSQAAFTFRCVLSLGLEWQPAQVPLTTEWSTFFTLPQSLVLWQFPQGPLVAIWLPGLEWHCEQLPLTAE